MTYESQGEMWAHPGFVANCAYRWFREEGEWPNVADLHLYLANIFGCPVEAAAFDVHNALERGDVYGLPSVVAKRLGEAKGDWREPLAPGDNGFRIAVPPADLEPRPDLRDFEMMYQLSKRMHPTTGQS